MKIYLHQELKMIVLSSILLCLILTVSCNSADLLYEINFEDLEIIEYSIACFNDEYTKSSLSFTNGESGFRGNVFKAKVSEPSQGDTWWVSGIKFKNNETTNESMFENLHKISFKYKSSVDYSNETKFMIQVVWKNNVNEMEIVDIWVEFPIINTDGKVSEFEILINDYTREILNTTKNYYLDWIMVGLESGAGEDFNPGTFYIDDIKFISE